MENAEIDLEIEILQTRICKIRKLRQLQQQIKIIEFGKLPDDSVLEIIQGISIIVCEHFNISPELLFSKRRTENITLPRQVVFYIAREFNLTLEAIGKEFGKDHGTVLYGCRHIKEKMSVEPEFKQLVEDLQNRFNLSAK